jgi:hypothetical protein
LSDASNLSFQAGKLLNKARTELLNVSSRERRVEIVANCNVAIKQTYLYNLKQLYPSLRIVCEGAELEKQQS